MEYTTITVTHEGAIDWLCLNRPERLNTISPRMCDELQHYFDALERTHSTRVVILRGAGRAFCAGIDLRELGSGEASVGAPRDPAFVPVRGVLAGPRQEVCRTLL